MRIKYLFIGLGNIGLPLVNRISKFKYEHFYVYDKNKALLTETTKKNNFLKPLNNLNDTTDFDIIFTCLPDSKTVKLVYKKITTINTKNKIFVDFSTISPEISKNNENLVKKIRSSYLQVPIFGSPNQAMNGTLYLLIAGSKLDYKKNNNKIVNKILKNISRERKYIKKVEVASSLKIIQNGLGLIQFTAIAESLLRCEDQKINSKLFIQTVLNAKGMAFSPLFEYYAPKLIKKNQKKTATLNLVYKDLNENIKLTNNISNLSLFKQTFDIYKKIIRNGHGHRSHLDLLRFLKNGK